MPYKVAQAVCAGVDVDCTMHISTDLSGLFRAGDVALIHLSKDIAPGEYAAAKWPDGACTIVQAFDVGSVRVYVSACEDSNFAPVIDTNLPFEILGKIVGVQFAAHSNTAKTHKED